MAAPVLAVIVAAHREGGIIVPTLRSLSLAASAALHHGLQIRIIIILDSATPATKDIIMSWADASLDISVFETRFGCPARARNFGIENSSSDYICIHDADDLMDKDWLWKGVDVIKNSNGESYIVHPEWNVTFGDNFTIMRHLCMNEAHNVYMGNLFLENYWTALCISSRQVFEKINYRSNACSNIYGYEDWDWNLRVLEAGSKHVIASETYHFVRRKGVGVSHNERTNKKIVRSSGYFLSTKFGKSFVLNNGTKNLNQNFEKKWFNEDIYLDCNRDIYEGVTTGYFNSGYNHYIDHGFEEGRTAYPKKFYEALLDASKYEYALFPDSDLYKKYKNYFPAKHDGQSIAIANAFAEFRLFLLLKTIGKRIDNIVVAPWVQRGGADLALLFHLEYLSKQKRRVLLILTEAVDSAWISRVPSNIHVMEFGKICKYLDPENKVRLLFSMISLSKLSALHVVNSACGWDLIDKYGEELHHETTISVSLYCYDYAESGKPVGYPFNLQRCSGAIDKIFTDNNLFALHLSEHYGISGSKIVVLKHPIRIKDRGPSPYRQRCGKILWASRLDRQKRPDILLRIAERMPEFDFHVYGSNLLSTNDIGARLSGISNVYLEGEFNDFEQTLARNYFVFLYTAEWDGLPNIILEAAFSCLPIIAPKIGGLTEFLGEGRGFLVDACDDVDGYISAIRAIDLDPELVLETTSAMRLYLDENHSYEVFFDSLRVAGY